MPTQKQRKWIKRGIELLVILALLFSFRAYQQWEHPEQPPSTTGQLISGEFVSLEQYRGAPLLVHVWATWCGICVLEQDSIESISKDYPVLTIAMQSGNRATMLRYLEENGLSFATLNDPQGTLSRSWGIQATPSSFILDSNGEIQFTEVGYTTEWGLRLRLWLAAYL